MNEILKLKKNHPCPSNNEIRQLINERILATESFIQENELRLSEDQRRIEDLSRQLSIAKDKIHADKKILEDKLNELKAESEKLKNLEKEKHRLAKNNYTLERKCRKLRMLKPNSKDECILNLCHEKFNLYKQLTRIRWDYGALEETTKGLVTDKKNYLHTFCYPKTIKSEELSDLLWKEIELSTETKTKDDGDKENSPSNT